MLRFSYLVVVVGMLLGTMGCFKVSGHGEGSKTIDTAHPYKSTESTVATDTNKRKHDYYFESCSVSIRDVHGDGCVSCDQLEVIIYAENTVSPVMVVGRSLQTWKGGNPVRFLGYAYEYDDVSYEIRETKLYVYKNDILKRVEYSQ